jgi:hypothetical protein
MRRALHLLAVALTLATSALLAPVAHADPAPPQLPSQPQSFFFLPSGTNYKYYDSDGWGTLNVTNAGYGYGTGVQLIKVQLKQNGNTFYGSGISYGGLLVFTMSDYVFQVEPTGWGSYHPSGNPYNQTWFWLQYP